MAQLNYKEAHKFVRENKKNGFYWDGYTIVKWFPTPRGFTSTDGMFKNDQWGIAYKYNMSNKGTWFIPTKYVKHT